MWKRITVFLVIAIVLIPIIHSEENSVVEPEVVENLEANKEVPVIIELQAPETNIEGIDVEHLSGDEYTARISKEELEKAFRTF